MTIDEHYNKIKQVAAKTNAFITLLPEKEISERVKNTSGPLAGLTFVLKDSYITKGIRTTAASNVLGDYIPQYSATVYQRLVDAGAILVGKMNMDAWGHGGTSENTDFGPVKNPWDLTRVAGGSGGGPAVAIITDCVDFAIGEDTGGSIRTPAAWCGITGLKVTYGRVSRYGCIAYASSFDTVGPTARSAEVCAKVLGVIAGKDPYDATSSPRPVPDYLKLLKDSSRKGVITAFKKTPDFQSGDELNADMSSSFGRGNRGLKSAEDVIGVPKEFFGEGLDEENKKFVLSASEKLKKLGYTLKNISLPILDYVVPVAYIIAPSETSSNLARYDAVRYGSGRDKFTAETKRRIMLGTYALSAGYYEAYYKKAQQVRSLFIKAYSKALEGCDVILMPINPTPPPKIGELINNPVESYLADIYTYSQNPVGLPSLALPCGFTKSNLPIGMQLVGKMFSEDLLLGIGYRYQQVTDWHTRVPKL